MRLRTLGSTIFAISFLFNCFRTLEAKIPGVGGCSFPSRLPGLIPRGDPPRSEWHTDLRPAEPPALTPLHSSAKVPRMVKAKKSSSGASARAKASSKLQKRKSLTPAHPPQRGGVEMVDPLVQAQMKLYDEALGLFHQQKFQRAKQDLEKVVSGPSKELAYRSAAPPFPFSLLLSAPPYPPL